MWQQPSPCHNCCSNYYYRICKSRIGNPINLRDCCKSEQEEIRRRGNQLLLTVLLIWVEEGALHLLVQPLFLLQPSCFCMNLDHVSNNTRNSLNGLCEISSNSFKTCTQAFMQHMEQENLFPQLLEMEIKQSFLPSFCMIKENFLPGTQKKEIATKLLFMDFRTKSSNKSFCWVSATRDSIQMSVCLSVCPPTMIEHNS